MTLEEARRILGAEVLAGGGLENISIEIGCGADLMSDVLSFSRQGALLLTGLTNEQVVRTSEMAEIRAICFVRGKTPPEKTVRMARSHGLPLLATPLRMFEACGLLYGAGLKGCAEPDPKPREAAP